MANWHKELATSTTASKTDWRKEIKRGTPPAKRAAPSLVGETKRKYVKRTPIKAKDVLPPPPKPKPDVMPQLVEALQAALLQLPKDVGAATSGSMKGVGSTLGQINTSLERIQNLMEAQLLQAAQRQYRFDINRDRDGFMETVNVIPIGQDQQVN